MGLFKVELLSQLCATYVSFYMYNNPDALMEGKNAGKLNKGEKIYILLGSLFLMRVNQRGKNW